MNPNYILVLIIPNSFNVAIGIEALDEKSAKSKASSMIKELQPSEVQVYPIDWIVNHCIPQPAIWIYNTTQQEQQNI